MDNNASKQQLVAIMTVEISPTVSDPIYIHYDDDPRDLAIFFASKHDLPGRLLLKLVDSISQHKKVAMQTLQNNQQSSPQKHTNYFKQQQSTTDASSVFNRLHTNRSTRKSSKYTVSPMDKRQSISPEQGSRLFYMRQEIDAKKQEKLDKHRQSMNVTQQLTFTPEINKVSEQIVQRKNELANSKKVEERLLSYGKQREQALQQRRADKMMDELVSDSKYPYQPKITNRSYEILNQSNCNTHRKLFSKTPSSDSFAIYLPQQDHPIVHKVWMTCIRRLFKQIDKLQGGTLTTDSCDLSKLEYVHLQIIAPILVEMEEQQVTLNFEQFYERLTNYCIKHNFVEQLLTSMLNIIKN